MISIILTTEARLKISKESEKLVNYYLKVCDSNILTHWYWNRKFEKTKKRLEYLHKLLNGLNK